MKIASIAFIAGLAFSCGKIDKTEITSTPIPGSENSTEKNLGAALVVNDANNLPACNAGSEGQLIFVRSQSVFATCVSGQWTGIDVSGGNNGLLTSVVCQMTIAKATLTAAGLDGAPDSGINFAYNVSTFGNGSKYVQARISSGDMGLSNGIFWDKSQDYYKTSESDSLVYDVHGAEDFGFWYMSDNAELTGDANNPFAVIYVDPAFEEAKMLVFDTATNCKIQSTTN